VVLSSAMASSSDSEAAPRRVRARCSAPTIAVAPLVQVLAGNSVTGPTILACLNTADTGALRQLCPAVAGVVAGVPWRDMDTPVFDVVRWRAALPAAVGALCGCLEDSPKWPVAAEALAGVTHLDLRGCGNRDTAAVSAHLAPSLRVLIMRDSRSMMSGASLAHLTALESLECDDLGDQVERLPASLRELRLIHCNLPPTADFRHLASLRLLLNARGDLSSTVVANLPPSLEVLDIGATRFARGASLAHLPRLLVLHSEYAYAIYIDTVASLPPCLTELILPGCKGSPTFAHLPALRLLDVSASDCNDASLASLPPSLVALEATSCHALTPDAVFPHLPALTLLGVSDTPIGDALVASLPPSLVTLTIEKCRHLTSAATLDHLPVLRVLRSVGTGFSEATLAACRARGCAAPADGALEGHDRAVTCLAVLPDGRLASGDEGGTVRVWDVGQRGKPALVLSGVSGAAWALAALPDGRRLAVGCERSRRTTVEVCGVTIISVSDDGDTHAAPVEALRSASVCALAVLADGRLAADCGDGAIRVVDVDAPEAEVVVLAGHTARVSAFAVLPDGRLASGSWDASVRVWDVGARACVATLKCHGYNPSVRALAVLADGRLASGEEDGTVRLWDVGTATCMEVLTGHDNAVVELAVLPDGRLASASLDCTIRLWTLQDDDECRLPASTCAPATVIGPLEDVIMGLVVLPDGRLASADGFYVRLWQPPPPGTGLPA